MDIIGIFVRAWLAMLLLGMVHHDHIASVPAFGYMTTLMLTALVTVATTPWDAVSK